MKRYLIKYRNSKRVAFVITFDEYGVIDTIERDGKLIASNTSDAKAILRNSEKVYAGVVAPSGFTWGR